MFGTILRSSTKAAPRMPRTFAASRRCYAGPVEGKIVFTLATPTATFLTEEPIDTVVLPGLEGEFQVLPNLAPLITELKPGVVITQSENEIKKYFVSGGFAFVHEDSTASCNPIECVELAHLDADLARAVATEAQQKFNSAQNDHDRAVAQIQLETANDIIAALAAHK